LIDGPAEIQPAWLESGDTVLVTAGASAPETVVQSCLEWLEQRFGATVEVCIIREESVSFPLPKVLRTLELAPQSDDR
jgi:4-hydroxy-3-methylbut-2-enyl diphosphate reductase